MRVVIRRSVQYRPVVSEPDNSKPDELCEAYSEIVPQLAPPDVFDPVIEAHKKDVLLEERRRRSK